VTKRKTTEAARRSLSRLERILLLVPYCVTHPGVSIGELAKRLGATEAEILDDLNLLFVCGLPEYTPADLMEVFIDEDRVYIRMADYFGRPLRLTRTEAIPLYVKGQALVNLLEGTTNGRGGLRELTPLRSALDKLGRALLPQEGGVAELTKRIKVQLESGEAQWLELLREAITDHRAVDLEYYTYTRDALTRRRVEPHLVFATVGHWYMSGYCHLAQDRRMFRLDRIKSLDLTEDRFNEPTEAEAELPPPLFYVPGPDDITVRIRASTEIAEVLSEWGHAFPPLPVQSSRDIRGGKRELTFRTSSALEWIEKLLLRFGGDIEVLEPAELGDRVREAAKRMLALYAKPKR
jgi:proteasome accessory factor C